MDTSRPEAETRLKRSLALKALATAEAIALEAGEIEAKVKELSRGFSDSSNIDPVRLREAVQEDLMREKLLGFLEANSTISEKAPSDDGDTQAKPAAKKAAAKKAKAEADETDADA